MEFHLFDLSFLLLRYIIFLTQVTVESYVLFILRTIEALFRVPRMLRREKTPLRNYFRSLFPFV